MFERVDQFRFEIFVGCFSVVGKAESLDVDVLLGEPTSTARAGQERLAACVEDDARML
jgi:hypothetical protein